MESDSSRIIIEDWAIANKKVEDIIKDKIPNYLVVRRNYLHPVIDEKTILDKNHRQGELVYYTKIQEGLKKLLNVEEVRYSSHFADAPDIIKKNKLMKKLE